MLKIKEIDDLFPENSVILTPNRRLSAFLVKEIIQQNAQKQHCVQVKPIHEFVKELKLNLQLFCPFERQVLTDIQNKHLWSQIIDSSSYNDGLIKVSSTVESARQAIKLMKLWQIAEDEFYSYVGSDAYAIIEWHKEYKRITKELLVYDSESELDYICELLSEHKMHLPKTIVLCGFAEIPPLQKKLLHTISTSDTRVCKYVFDNNAEAVKVLAYDPSEEWECAARWAKCAREKGYDNIAVVVPSLDIYRNKVARCFYKYFEESELNISAPAAIIKYPIIKDIILSLKLLKDKVAYNDLSIWLRLTKYLRVSREYRADAALLDRELNRLGQKYITWQQVNRAMSLLEPSLDRGLVADISKIEATIAKIQDNLTSNSWAQLIQQFITDLGWPGHASLNKLEYDLLACWHGVLDSYNSVNFIFGAHSFIKSINTLTTILANTPFSPETDKAKVHVLGVLEASGVPFDRVWVTGMDDKHWPPEPKPNPFIPDAIHRKYNLPRSSFSRELEVAKEITNDFTKNVRHQVVFSNASFIDGNAVRSSRLIDHFAEVDAGALAMVTKDVTYATTKLEYYSDEQGMPIDKIDANGGAYAIQDQALCPIRAYARYRLSLKPLTKKYLGVSAIEHGILVHNIMRLFWDTYTYEDIQDADNEDILTNVKAVVSDVIRAWKLKNIRSINESIHALEQSRLINKIHAWVMFEKKRDYFKVVNTEHKLQASFAGHKFSFRADRIDLVDGKNVVVDYKTGVPDAARWFKDRPRDPQLPVYALQDTVKVGGVVYACISGTEEFKGVLWSEDIYSGAKKFSYYNDKLKIEDTWEALLTKWGASVESICKEYVDGVAKVDPVDGSQTCRGCDFSLFCRKDAVSA